MPFVWLGVTVSPPCTAADSVTVNVIAVPSLALASFTVTAALSSLLIVPVPVSLDVMVRDVPDTVRPIVKVSSASKTASSVVETVNVFVSLAVPVKLSAVVLAV